MVSGSTDTETRGQDTQQVGWGRKKCGKWCLTDFAWQPTAGGPWSNNALCKSCNGKVGRVGIFHF